MEILKLTLQTDCYNAVIRNRKVCEYRARSAYWRARIWAKRLSLTHIRFRRASTRQTTLRRITKIDEGMCPYVGCDGTYIRIHFKHLTHPLEIPDSV